MDEILRYLRCWWKTGHAYVYKRSLKVTIVYECKHCGWSKWKYYFRDE